MKTKYFLVFLSLVVSGCLDGCKSNFPVTINNRTDDPIEVFANGENLGAVSANGVQRFTVESLPGNSSSSYSNNYARVDFVFKNINTGKTTRSTTRVLRQKNEETIDVEKYHFR